MRRERKRGRSMGSVALALAGGLVLCAGTGRAAPRDQLRLGTDGLSKSKFEEAIALRLKSRVFITRLEERRPLISNWFVNLWEPEEWPARIDFLYLERYHVACEIFLNKVEGYLSFGDCIAEPTAQVRIRSRFAFAEIDLRPLGQP